MADKRQGEITNMLHRYQMFTRHEKPRPIVERRGKWLVVIGYSSDDLATPDLVGGNRYQVHVEVKTGTGNSFSFSEWKEHQRAWASEWRDKYCAEYWLGITIETPHSPHRVKRVAYLIPYQVALDTEELLSPIQGSIPYLAVKGYSRELQDKQWDACHLWEEFALTWTSKIGWELPDNHPFRSMYLKDVEPLHYTGAGIKERIAHDKSDSAA